MCKHPGCNEPSDTAYCSKDCRVEATNYHYFDRREERVGGQ